MRKLLWLICFPFTVVLAIIEGLYALAFNDLERWCMPASDRFMDWVKSEPPHKYARGNESGRNVA
jgi:hypothetical protein